MFRDGNNQAMQLVMQGYSDSIRAKTSNQGLAMANAFNQGLSNAVQTHDNHEQAMQNREATRLQNEYMNRTMDDRVRHQVQQTKANDLANEYTERTLDDRVAHQEQQTIANGLANEAQFLNNNLQAMKNDTFKRTQESNIGAINAINYSKTADAQKQKTIIEYEHAAYKGTEQPLQDENGNYYLARYDKENGKSYRQYIHEDDARRRIETNAQAAATRKATTQGETSKQQANTTGLQAQTAQNINSMENANQQKAAFDEAKTAIQASGDTYDEIVYKLGEAARNNEPQITLRNGTKMSVEMASMLGNGMLRGNSGGIGGGININHADKSTIRERDIDAAYNLYDDKDDPQARDRIAMQQKYKKEYGEISKSLESIGHFSQIMQDLGDKNRASLAIGSLTRFIGGGEDYAKFKAQNSITLASMAKQTFGGQISDRDMQIMGEQTAKMWESTPATMARLEQTLANQISTLKGKIKGTPIGINIMTPEQQQQYIGLTQLYQAIMQGKKN